MPQDINLLLVEDEFLNRLYTKNTLESFGYNSIFEARSAEDALKILDKEKIDFAILDINLGSGKEDGLSLGRKINEKYKFPFVYLTAYGTKQMLQKAKSNNPSGFLVKPFTEIELLASIELAVNNIPNLQPTDTDNELLVKQNDKYVKLSVAAIVYLESDKNYLRVVTENDTYKYRCTIKKVLELLNKQDFIQIHRAFVVNRRFVNNFSLDEIQCGEYVLPVSRNYRDQLQLK